METLVALIITKTTIFAKVNAPKNNKDKNNEKIADLPIHIRISTYKFT